MNPIGPPGETGSYPQTDPALKTVRWRNAGRPEQSLVGVQYITQNDWDSNTDYMIINSDHWVYAGTGFSDGNIVRGIIGYEVDTVFEDLALPKNQSHTILADSPFTGRNGTSVNAHASIYQAPSGAWVFTAGTMTLPWALLREEYVDARMQRSMNNILQRFIRQIAK